jgi:hypothetical protein
MSHENYAKDRLSYRLPSLLPEYLRDEGPVLELFLKAYFEYLEAEILVLSTVSHIDGIANEDGTGSIFLESATVSPSPDEDSSRILHERTGDSYASPFKIGEYVVGTKSKSVAKIEVVNGSTLYLKSISGNGFTEGETVTGRISLQTGIVKSFKENSILANNRLLDYSDIDNTTEDFLKYFQKDFMPNIDLASLQNSRLTIKNIKDLYKKKGTEESLQFLMRVLYAQDAEIRYPVKELITVGESGYSQQRKMRVTMTNGIPEANDKVTQYSVDGSGTILAQAIIENVYVDVGDDNYSFEISNNHVGTFTEGSTVTILDRDGITTLTATINGIVSDITTGSSTYISHDDSGDILLESGQAAVYSGTYDGSQLNTETTNGGGALLETSLSPFGSLYTLNDQINITGGKQDTDTTETKAVVNGLVEGPLTEILIEDAGINYEAGDLIVFEGGTGGGAEAIIGSTGDEVLLEGGTVFGHYEIDVTTGQTQIGGPGVKDKNGNYIIFNDYSIDVYLDGILKTPTLEYTWQNDRVVFLTAMTAQNSLVEIYTEYQRVTFEDGSTVDYDGYIDGEGNTIVDDGRIRSILLRDGGAFREIPKVYPGGYLYVKSTTGFEVGEVVTGTTSSATGSILRIDAQNNRLIIKRLDTDTGVFVKDELLTGATTTTETTITQTKVTSGTGAKLFAYSDTAGGVESINIQDQGNKFNYDGVLSGSSYFPMLIKTPSANLTRDLVITGTLSGTTAKVVSYNADKHILTYRDLDGCFYPNEKVTFNAVDSFYILRTNSFDGRGLYAGEGIVEEQMVGDYGTVNAAQSRIQDGKFYQTHSYVVKVGESINKWRGIVKDLLHPAGHIFFGEVAIKNTIDTTVEDQVRFRPMVVINLEATLGVPNAFANSQRTVKIYTLDHEDLLMETGDGIRTEDGFGLIVTECGGRDLQPALLALREAGYAAYNTDPRTGNAVSSFAMVDGVQTGEGTEVYDSMMRSRHININIIQSHAVAVSQVGMYSHDGIPTVLSLDWNDNNWLNGRSEMLYRKASDGKITQLWSPQEETLILEDGGVIEIEEPANFLRLDERLAENVYYQGDYGERILNESDGTLILLETATSTNQVQHFVSERSIEMESGGLYYEDGDRIVMETEQVFIQEDMSEVGITSYVPLGSTFRSLNTITGQRTFDISYYLKDETDGDDLLLEDGTGNVLSEVSKAEGLRIKDLDNYYPNLHVPEYQNQERKRTNITYSAYIKSA